MALYHLALEGLESDRGIEGLLERETLTPAILVGLTGRLVEYPLELLERAKEELFETLALTARMSLASEFPLSVVEEQHGARISKCHICTLSDGIQSKSP